MEIKNEEEAYLALKALSQYYREPVKKMSDYCASIWAWFDALEAKYREEKTPDISDFGDTPLHDIGKIVPTIRIAIHKSSMLGRLMYEGEKLRTKKCPIHNGTWSGLEHPERICPHNCNLTGWIGKE